MENKSIRDRIFIALDFPSEEEALACVDGLGDEGTSYKVGLQLFTKAGPGFIKKLKDRNKNVFLDLKFHDIPNTVRNQCAHSGRNSASDAK